MNLTNGSKTSSIPTIEEFHPGHIKWQWDFIRSVRSELDYSLGVHHILLSGSVGSAKSIAMAHCVVTHCLANPGAHVGIGRLSMPALKGTLYDQIKQHLGNNVAYDAVDNQAIIRFPNGSIIRGFSWQDKKYKKVRSYEFTAFAIEELTENDTEDAFKEICLRMGRATHVEERWVICATNPDDPSHWAYKYFMESDSDTRHVHYSLTEQNPFLPKSYVKELKNNLDPKMAKRMLEGQWIFIAQDVIYYQYDRARNFVDKVYTPAPNRPVYWTHDFNIGEGKPMSSCFFQYDNGVFHFFDEIIMDGANTHDVCEEAFERLKHVRNIVICGDASGKSRDTRGVDSDFDILLQFCNKLPQRPRVELMVPAANPGVRLRHNKVNAACLNANGRSTMIVYGKCKTVDEGLRYTKLKKGGQYLEDDSDRCQHVTTALGYGVYAATELNSGPSAMAVTR